MVKKLDTYPECLLALEVGVSGVAPETTRDKASLCVLGLPVEPRSNPVLLGPISWGFLSSFLSLERMLVSVERVLLIVRSKLEREHHQRESTQDIVGGTELIVWLQDGGSADWKGEPQKQQVLNDDDES